MDFNDSPPEAAVRAEARAWLESAFPEWLHEHPARFAYDLERARSWHRRLFEGGWAAPSWPPDFGGRGFGPAESMVWEQEKTRVGADIPFDIPGFGMAGPTIIFHGTPQQKGRYLPPLIRGDETWCQLFSEPEAGSDLAAVRTRAERDGDEWVVTGQKVWSSGAHEADRGILLARFDPELPKHKGLVYLLIDMRAAGIEVRPLKQMDGGSHFNEVFLEGVRVPDADRLGEPGEGWRVAMTTLMHERVSLGGMMSGFAVAFDRLADLAGNGERARPLTRQGLARVYTQHRLLELLSARIVSKLGRGQIPDAEGSIMKLVLANLVSDAAELAVELLGPEGMLADGELQQAFLGSRAFHIGGGTDEVQRNVIAERVLGLPREPRKP
ncbi:MAG: acyl-CoA dehydrogenase family protein [Actinomycetota bacterium]